MQLSALLAEMEFQSNAFVAFCNNIPEEKFFTQPPVKWSVAQNVAHLITSASMTRIAYRLPKFIIRWYTGKPNRHSRSYDELVSKYKRKLEEGGKASGKFNTPPVKIEKGKERIVKDFSTAMNLLHKTIGKQWKDDQLDNYLAPHPLLGKITQRELLYFTIYHIHHHKQIISERLAEQI